MTYRQQTFISHSSGGTDSVSAEDMFPGSSTARLSSGSPGGRGGGSSLGLHVRALIPNDLPNTPPPNTTTFGVKISTCKIEGGDTNVQSIAMLLPKWNMSNMQVTSLVLVHQPFTEPSI